MDLDSFLTERYVMIDEWWQTQPDAGELQVGRPAALRTDGSRPCAGCPLP
jgi:hypothetical protein